MNRSGRRRISKWDLKEQSQSSIEQGNLPIFHGVSDRHSSGISSTDAQPQWNEDESYNRSWSRSPNSRRSRSPRSRSRNRSRSPSRGFKRDSGDNNKDRDQRQFFQPINHNFVDKNHPCGASPNRGRSRSQSRSPPRSFRRESEVLDRSRSKNKDQSQLSNQINQNHADRNYPRNHSPNGYKNRLNRKDNNVNIMKQRPFRDEICNNFLKGRCERGTSCRYVHQHTSSNETIREREDDRRNTSGPSFEHDGWREQPPPPRSGGDIPCKFFASGNCRNGENCRFTHYTRESQSTSSDRWRRDHKSDVLDLGKDLKQNNSRSVFDGANSREENYRKQNISEPRVNLWSKNDDRGHNLENYKLFGCSRSFGKTVEPDGKESVRSKNEKIGSMDSDINTGYGDMEMSPEWSYNAKSPNHMNEEKLGYVNQTSQTLENPNEVSLPTSNGIQHTASASVIHPNMFGNTYSQQYPVGNNTSSSHFDLRVLIGNLPGQTLYQYNAKMLENQQAMTMDSKNIHNQSTSPDILPMQQMNVSNANVQLTNISASLAQLYGNQQHNPQLHIALNPQNTLPQSNEPFPPAMPQMQYDPFSPNPIGEKMISEDKTDMPSMFFPPISIANGQGTPGEVGNKNNEVGLDEIKKTESETKKTKENRPVQNTEDEESGPGEGKKNKDANGIKAFKFALVEFVKELLKPSWKENKINKDAYKTIVGKVIDKVTGTLQGAHIPQTQEKIEQYLSLSKPKLTKLVQAYVEKHQKS